MITSFRPPGESGAHLLLVASTTLPQEPCSPPALKLRIPHVDAYFTGTGALGHHQIEAGDAFE